MTSVLMTPDGKTVEAEAAHGTVTRHYRQHQAGQADVDESDRVDLRLDAWPRASRLSWTRLQRSIGFAEALERVCIETVEGGQMTKDLALLVGPIPAWLTTEDFLAAIDANLRQAIG